MVFPGGTKRVKLNSTGSGRRTLWRNARVVKYNDISFETGTSIASTNTQAQIVLNWRAGWLVRSRKERRKRCKVEFILAPRYFPSSMSDVGISRAYFGTLSCGLGAANRPKWTAKARDLPSGARKTRSLGNKFILVLRLSPSPSPVLPRGVVVEWKGG